MAQNPELNDALAQLVQQITNGLNYATDFTLEQAPDVIHQLILFNLINSGFFLGLGIAGLLVAWRIVVWTWRANYVGRHYGKAPEDDSPKWWNKAKGFYEIDLEAWGLFPAIVLGTTSLIIIMCKASNFLKLLLAPKVWLLEYAARLIN